MAEPESAHKIALVTGGGTGIGRGIVLALARRGIDVALVGRRPEPLEQVAHRVEVMGVRAIIAPADLSDMGQLDQVVSKVHKELGPVYYLVNNAAQMSSGALSSLSRATVQSTIGTNLLGPIELTRILLPDLIATKGTVILLASSVSHAPLPYASLYSATKAGVRALGDALRFEFEPLGVHVLVAYPPATATAMVSGMAARAGITHFPLAPAGLIGERIVRAAISGKSVVYAAQSEYLFSLSYRFAPALLRVVFRSRRSVFARMMSLANEADSKHS